MKKLLTSCLLTCAALTQTLEASPQPPNFNVDIAGGYRVDQFRWASRGANDPTDLTEHVSWKNLQIAEISGFMTYTTCTNWYFRVNGGYGRIYSGHTLEKDYSEVNNKSILEEKNKGNGGKGEVFNVAGGVGYMFVSSGGRLLLAPLIGYIHSEQHLHINNVENVFLRGSNPIGKVDYVHSKYKTRWYGGFAAWDFLLDWNCSLKFFGTLQGQLGNYRGRAQWNARDDIHGDINHKANYVGFNGLLGFLYNIFCNNYIGVSGTYFNLWTHHGSQKLNRTHYFLDRYGYYAGQENRDYKQKFHARWRSWSVQANWMIHY